MEYAIFEDCRKLIDHFIGDGDSSFPSFCKQWKKLKFQHIYSGQTSYIEIMQTTAAVIHYARRELCCCVGNDNSKSIAPDLNTTKNTTAQHYTDEEIRRRIGCLFILYAIYFKQPTERYMKIETSLNTWQTINNFINSLPMTADMDSARYVFFRLLEADAFRFTALNYCVGLEELVDYDKLNDKENTEFWSKSSSKELGQQLQDFPSTQRILPALSVLEDGYNEMKEMLIKTNTSGMHKKSLPSTTIFKSIEKCFQNIQSILDDDEGRVKKYKSMSVENKRRNLKRKGFTNAIEANVSNDEVVDVKKKKYKTLRRMSARTVFTDELPADLLEDLEEQESAPGVDEDVGTIQSSENEEADGNTSEMLQEKLIDAGIIQSSENEGKEEITNDVLDNLTNQSSENDSLQASKDKRCKLENRPENNEETIEQQINQLLDIELAEEFISIPPKEK